MDVIQLCGSNLCMENAVSRIFWPGNAPLYQCIRHLAAALKVAEAMGLHLHHEPIEPLPGLGPYDCPACGNRLNSVAHDRFCPSKATA